MTIEASDVVKLLRDLGRSDPTCRVMAEWAEYAISDLAELFSVSRPTVYRTLSRQQSAKQS